MCKWLSVVNCSCASDRISSCLSTVLLMEAHLIPQRTPLYESIIVFSLRVISDRVNRPLCEIETHWGGLCVQSLRHPRSPRLFTTAGAFADDAHHKCSFISNLGEPDPDPRSLISAQASHELVNHKKVPSSHFSRLHILSPSYGERGIKNCWRDWVTYELRFIRQRFTFHHELPGSQCFFLPDFSYFNKTLQPMKPTENAQ